MSLKNLKKKNGDKGRGMLQVVQHLLSKSEALSLNPRTDRKKM
jgi:hypothetical protein